MKSIELLIECPSCAGTGVYSGMAERDGAAVVCNKCKGTGEFLYKFNYNEFTGRKPRKDVKRVYLSGYGYVIGTSPITFGETLVDMSREGVSYEEFCNGKMPSHIKGIACPMLADQEACYKIDDFVQKCEEIHGGWISRILDCKGQPNKADCWKRFEAN